MKKQINRTLSILLAVVMVLCTVPVIHGASIVDSGYCGGEGDGTNLTWTLDSSGLLTISGTGAMADYQSGEEPFLDGIDNIYTVNIKSGVTSIGSYGFTLCYKVTSVTIPDSVTSIGDYAFEACYKLTSVTIPSSVTNIGKYVFSNCYNLTGIFVNQNNPNYASESGCLYNKSKTKLIQYPIGNSRNSFTIPDGVTSIGDFSFGNCERLTSVTIPDGVTSIDYQAFSGCKELRTVTIPVSVTSIGHIAFANCRSLSDVYYGGSKKQWNSFAFGVGNDELLSATIHFHSLGFKFGRDNNSFRHYPDSFFKETEKIYPNLNPDYSVGAYEIDLDMFKTFIEKYCSYYSLSNRQRNMLYQALVFRMLDKWGGSCFGISATIALTYLGELKLSNFVPGVSYYYDLPNPKANSRFRSLINIYHLAQQLQIIADKKTEVSYDPNDPLPSFNELLTLLTLSSKAQNEDIPFLFLFNYTGITSGKPAGHTLVCFGREDTDEYYRLKFVDPNSQDGKPETQESFIYARIPKDLSSFEFEENAYTGITQIGHCELSALDCIDFDGDNNNQSYTGMKQAPKNEEVNQLTKIAFDSSSKFNMTFSDGKELIFDGLDLSGTLDDYKIDYVQNGESLGYIITLEQKDGCSITSANNELDLYIQNGLDFYGFIGSGVEQIDIEIGNSVSVTGSEMEYTLFYGIDKENIDLIKLHGNHSDLIRVTDSSKSLEITTNNVGSLEVTGFDDGAANEMVLTITENGAIIPFETEPHTHTYTATVTTPATCTEPGIMTYTCVDGDDTYTETIPALGHTDDNNDGHCDRCGTQMTGGDHCKFCGKIHNGGFFDKLTGFFHKIFAIFKR